VRMVRLRVPDGKWAPAEPFRAREGLRNGIVH
jgi:hypothetical protein